MTDKRRTLRWLNDCWVKHLRWGPENKLLKETSGYCAGRDDSSLWNFKVFKVLSKLVVLLLLLLLLLLAVFKMLAIDVVADDVVSLHLLAGQMIGGGEWKMLFSHSWLLVSSLHSSSSCSCCFVFSPAIVFPMCSPALKCI